MHVYIHRYLTHSVALTFIFLLQVSLGERQQANLHRQDTDLPAATTAGTHANQTVAISHYI